MSDHFTILRSKGLLKNIIVLRKLERYFRGSDSTNDFPCLRVTIKVRLFCLLCVIPFPPLHQDDGPIHFYIQCSILIIFLLIVYVFHQEKETLRVVTIAMVCSTLASLWKFQYFRKPIFNPVEHLWWSILSK